ncbi:MAG TPA: lactonase family protein [Flavobacterium sp.]
MKTYIIPIYFLLFLMNASAQKNHFNLLIGTYTHSCESNGIYVYDFNSDTAEVTLKSSTQKVINPSYLSVSEKGDVVYSVNENGPKSTISAFKFDGKKLALVNQKDSEGADPCHIINDENNILTANYSGGSISIFGKKKDGSLTNVKQVIKHSGNSASRQRQEGPHVHMVQFSPDKKFVLATDLGTDRIYIYNYNPKSTKEVLIFKDTVPIKTGSGPRHLTFHPNGKFIYLLQELDGSVTVFNYLNGKTRLIQEVSLLSQNQLGSIGAAAVRISADGKFLYATNRGDANTISVFEIVVTGKLQHVETISSGGQSPRDFNFDPTGKFLLVAHEKSNEIVIYERSSVTGKLKNTGNRIQLCAPVNIEFVMK